ncbi:MAG TPA: hypothetical protein VE732_00105 [Nitrososphaera sp.]|nr:hypothetical protein [Nitrososphaera sp.]
MGVDIHSSLPPSKSVEVISSIRVDRIKHPGGPTSELTRAEQMPSKQRREEAP